MCRSTSDFTLQKLGERRKRQCKQSQEKFQGPGGPANTTRSLRRVEICEIFRSPRRVAARHEAGIAKRCLQRAVRPTFATGKSMLRAITHFIVISHGRPRRNVASDRLPNKLKEVATRFLLIPKYRRRELPGHVGAVPLLEIRLVTADDVHYIRKPTCVERPVSKIGHYLSFYL